VPPVARDLLTGISLANLCFIAVWDEVLAVTRNRYLLDVSSADVAAVILNVLLVGTAFAAAATLARRHPSPWPRRIVRAVFLAVLLVPLWRLVRDFNPLYLERLLYRLGQPMSQRQVFRELAPYPLFPLDDYFHGPSRMVPPARTNVIVMPLWSGPLAFPPVGRTA